jgi:parallel beta-helix repeat protein
VGTRILKGVLVAATVGIGAGMLAPVAAHAAVVCGQSITTSMTLTADLTCPGNGIFISASNVTLNLGGRTITGPAPISQSNRQGVSITTGRTGVKVINGTIRGFDRGLNLSSGADDALVSGVTLDANGLGIGSADTTARARISANSITNTVIFSAMQLGGAGHTVEGNTMTNGNGTGVLTAGRDLLIRGNRITDMGRSAIAVGPFPSTPGPFFNNRIVGNVIKGSDRLFNSTTISLNNASGTLVHGNTATGRRTTPGVFINTSTGTVVSQNLLDNHSTGVNVRASTGTRVTGNRASSNVNSGINVESTTTDTLISGNVVTANNNGITVGSPASTLTGNTAYSNTLLGISAVNGVTDGGGNRAFGNGNPAQCSPSIAC